MTLQNTQVFQIEVFFQIFLDCFSLCNIDIMIDIGILWQEFVEVIRLSKHQQYPRLYRLFFIKSTLSYINNYLIQNMTAESLFVELKLQVQYMSVVCVLHQIVLNVKTKDNLMCTAYFNEQTVVIFCVN